MRYFLRTFLKSSAALTAILIISTALAVQAAPTPDQSSLLPINHASEARALLLAQKTEPAKENKISPAPPPKESKPLKTMGAPPCPQMERMEKSVIRDDPGKAGTKKIGGQTIRAKETPGGE